MGILLGILFIIHHLEFGESNTVGWILKSMAGRISEGKLVNSDCASVRV